MVHCFAKKLGPYTSTETGYSREKFKDVVQRKAMKYAFPLQTKDTFELFFNEELA